MESCSYSFPRQCHFKFRGTFSKTDSDKFQIWHISHYLFFFSYIEILGCGSLKFNQVNLSRGKAAGIEFDISWKIRIRRKKCRTLKMNQVFLLLLSIDKGSRGQEKRDKLKNLGLSLGVEPAGVEPASKQGIHTLSTCLFPNQLSEVGRIGTNQPAS